jgi:hypothetical protein
MKQFYTYIHYKPDGVPFYVGKGCDRRAYDFRFTVRKNKWHDCVVRKFGKNNITVEVLNCANEDDAFYHEQLFIFLFREDGIKLCNMTDGGEGATGYIFTEKDRQKLRTNSAVRGTKGYWYGKKQPKEMCLKKSQSLLGKTKGRIVSAETIQKLREAHVGQKAWNKGIPATKEFKIKVSLAKQGSIPWNKGIKTGKNQCGFRE